MSMDAVEYVKRRRRMCDYYYENCGDCPACDYEWCSSLNGIPKMIPIVEKWEKEHPVKTRQSEFLQMWPDAEIGDDGLPAISPCQLNVLFIHGKAQKDCEGRGVCNKCRRDFWMREVK